MNSALNLNQLLARGDHISIECGRLMINPASGNPVPDEWLKANSDELVRDILTLMGMDAYWYVGYRTGRYGRHKAAGLTLLLASAVTGESFYAIFNVGLDRKRSVNGKLAGTPLPDGRFTVGERSAFVRFWQSTGLAYRRLSDFHDYMGNLKTVLFAGEASGERVSASTLRPVNIGVEALAAVTTSANKLSRLVPTTDQDSSAWQTFVNLPTSHRQAPDNSPTSYRQLPDKRPTRFSDKETQQSHQPSGLQPFSTTCVSNHGKAVIREDGYTGKDTGSDTPTAATDPHDYQQLVDLGWESSLPAESQFDIDGHQQSASTIPEKYPRSKTSQEPVEKTYPAAGADRVGQQAPEVDPVLSSMTEPVAETLCGTLSPVWDDNDVEVF